MNKLKVNIISLEPKKRIEEELVFEVNDGLNIVLLPTEFERLNMVKKLTTLSDINYGELMLNELDYKKDVKKIRRVLGYIPNEISMYPQLTGRNFLSLIYDMKCNKQEDVEKQIDEIIKSLELSKVIDEYISRYSFFEMYKISIAQALIGEPKIIIIDSIDNKFEGEEKESILKVIKDISKDKIIILVENNCSNIEDIADLFVIIDSEGSIKYQGDRSEIMLKVKEKKEDSISSFYIRDIINKEGR